MPCQCPLSAAEQSVQRTVVEPSGPSWTAVNPIPAKSRAAAGISQAMGLKVGRDRLSPAQLEAHDAITLAGGVVTTCRTLDEVAALLATLGVPSRVGAVMPAPLTQAER